MKFPSSNHRPQKEPVPKTVESNAQVVQEYLDRVDWKRFVKLYWYGVATAVGTVMAFILGVGVANKLVSLLWQS